MTITKRGWVLITAAVVALALVALISQGDPCDAASSPSACRVQLPDR